MKSAHIPRERDLVREVLERVAANAGIDPLEPTPLGAVTDPDALTEFVETSAVPAETTVQFEYEGCEITVYGDSRISVAELPPRPKGGVG